MRKSCCVSHEIFESEKNIFFTTFHIFFSSSWSTFWWDFSSPHHLLLLRLMLLLLLPPPQTHSIVWIISSHILQTTKATTSNRRRSVIHEIFRDIFFLIHSWEVEKTNKFAEHTNIPNKQALFKIYENSNYPINFFNSTKTKNFNFQTFQLTFIFVSCRIFSKTKFNFQFIIGMHCLNIFRNLVELRWMNCFLFKLFL